MINQMSQNENTQNVIYLLHEKGAYNTGVEEERFISEVQEWYQQKEGKAVDRDNIVDVMNNLYRIKVADFNDGKIIFSCLECVFLK